MTAHIITDDWSPTSSRAGHQSVTTTTFFCKNCENRKWAINYTGIFLCMRSANERRCYMVTSSLIGWAHTQNDHWLHHSLNSLICNLPPPSNKCTEVLFTCSNYVVWQLAHFPDCQFITVMPQEWQSISNDWQLDCLCLTACSCLQQNKLPKLCITGPLWGESISYWWFILTKSK